MISMIALYLIKGMVLRLVVVALFMIIFCLILAMLTNARMVEIFAATAAYVPQVRFPIWRSHGAES